MTFDSLSLYLNGYFDNIYSDKKIETILVIFLTITFTFGHKGSDISKNLDFK